ncbi:DNA repair ATPase [Deinococcus humi]|uniref:AAA+ ATPase domain-containing protein n=1 Tax=Deinococcus humi TaxID=662880 RepID=A0A7W8JRH3_9DEIO|nr:DNA repair ATPase [Deinococcus humi]MBB5361789.1 hypothetical protein [Deinococcus humi]GGO23688.1 hypothetical protein GCM10008949_12060 [Deinococcus humi]
MTEPTPSSMPKDQTTAEVIPAPDQITGTYPTRNPEQNTAEQTPAEETSGAYAVLSARLAAQGAALQSMVADLNAQRIAEFGEGEMTLLGRVRIHTPFIALGRDLVEAGPWLLFGFNAASARKGETAVGDVLSLYQLIETGGTYDVQPVPTLGTFLADPTFVRDFAELYAYYKDARLLQLLTRGTKLLAVFQMGQTIADVRVFRWEVSPTGEISYTDARGERDAAPPPRFDFEWIRAGRELEVSGRHPHLNILDTLYVETRGGTLTVKTENDTETGEGVYSEPVDDATQSLDDARFEYARVGTLILLRVLPYREQAWRGLIYNTLTRRVIRSDAMLLSCISLPEDHGIIFPGGFYTQSGEYREFDAQVQGMTLSGVQRSPNGEDVLYTFYEPVSGESALFVYNLIRRELAAPLFAHGEALQEGGILTLFQAESSVPTRVHPMQVWKTPFYSDEFASRAPQSKSALGRLGNAELVRGVSNLTQVARTTGQRAQDSRHYTRLTASARRLFEVHHWLADPANAALAGLLHEIIASSEAVLDEFEKVQSMRLAAREALDQARKEHRALLTDLASRAHTEVQSFVDALELLVAERGKLLSLRDMRGIDVAAVDAMVGETTAAHTQTGEATGAFLTGPEALTPLADEIMALETGLSSADAASSRELNAQLTKIAGVAGSLDTLSELLSGLPVEDAQARTAVIESISGLYAKLNALRARTERRARDVGEGEMAAQFAAQMNLYRQSVVGALGRADSPERATEELARLTLAAGEIESRFGESDTFVSALLTLRQETQLAFEERRQVLLTARERRNQTLGDTGARIVDGLGTRLGRLSSPEELQAFFAGDPLILRLRQVAGQLSAHGDVVRAGDLLSRLAAARDGAVRQLRDRSDLFEDGGKVIRLGPRHRFSVNTQPLELTLLPRDGTLNVHLTGTGFMQPLHDPVLDSLEEFWDATLESESPQVYRGEYLAHLVMQAARTDAAAQTAATLDAAETHGAQVTENERQAGLTMDTLRSLLDDPRALEARVRAFAAPHYRGGYEKGVHDHDAALIITALLPLEDAAGALIYPAESRALGVLFWASWSELRAEWAERVQSAVTIASMFGTRGAMDTARDELAGEISLHLGNAGIPVTTSQAHQAAEYLCAAIEATSQEPSTPAESVKLSFTRRAVDLADALRADAELIGKADQLRASLDAGRGRSLAQRWKMALAWTAALTQTEAWTGHVGEVPEAAAWLLFGEELNTETQETALITHVSGLIGTHPRITGGALTLDVGETAARLEQHRTVYVPGMRRYQEARTAVMEREAAALHLSEYQARPLTSFVRNGLIDGVYLPVIGDNLAKQIGTLGEGRRSDLMGLLMLISPPGYGKTTLMEYVASQLGLVFMRINGPSLGHHITSLDPALTGDSGSRAELEKLGLALEMGNNVMLYLDDIQHLSPSFLQKFISLTDGTRRIDGVWQGKPRTYDLRGRRFAVVMAGNPYTESGEVFRVPDMLANRADVYNLGDVLSGMQGAFLMSYIENSLTSNPVLAALSGRDPADLALLVERAQGREVSLSGLKSGLGEAEAGEMVETLRRLLRVRDVLSAVNAQYIASAAQDDRYRTEPPFRLQGSYRNMNRLAEKIQPVMNDTEIAGLIADHYLGEAQLLTSGAEENLLKLAEIQGTLTPDQDARWQQIRTGFLRDRAIGGAGTDVGGRVVAQLADIAAGMNAQTAALREGVREAEVRGHSAGWNAATQASILAALQSVEQELSTVRQREAAPSTATTAHPEPALVTLETLMGALEGALAPLLSIVASSSVRDRELSDSLGDIADALKGAQAHGRTLSLGRHPRKQDVAWGETDVKEPGQEDEKL